VNSVNSSEFDFRNQCLLLSDFYQPDFLRCNDLVMRNIDSSGSAICDQCPVALLIPAQNQGFVPAVGRNLVGSARQLAVLPDPFSEIQHFM